MSYYVYILCSKRNGTLYTGVTNDLARRVYAHKHKTGSIFTRKYNIGYLVYYESYGEIGPAIHRENRIKEWQRKWKLRLVESINPEWKDLYQTLNT